MSEKIDRRSFLKQGLFYAGLLAGAGYGLFPVAKSWGQSSAASVPRRRLGATGEEVSIIGLGGAIAVARERERAAEIVDRALDLGINYIDTAAQYGPSEANIGSVMRHRRGQAFLAGKSHNRSYDGTMRLFERSLSRLQTDYLDLYQLHAIDSQEALDEVSADNGALAAMRSLKEQKAVRYLGITSHKNARFFGQVLERYPFDCVLLALNCADRHYDSMIEHALPAARARGMGIAAMKVAAYDGRIFREDGIRTMEEALGYVLSHPVHTAVVGVSSVEELEQNAAIAHSFSRFSPDRMRELEQRTAHYQRDVNFFKHQW
ncbi:MAG: aldo/keto reductase [Spirochaetaceae bacterium]|nr:MAG: aldo/keto reductase [Spirochaetaceae bacterium]